MHTRIVVPGVPGWPHGQMYNEVAETLVHAFESLGHRAEIGIGTFAKDATNIVLGAHDLPDSMAFAIPPDAVLYNLEQIDTQFIHTQPHFKAVLAQHEVWDYSQQNVERLRAFVHKVHLLPIGTEKKMTRILAGQQDIDVLFYGTLNDRRRRILERMMDQGINVKYLFSVYGAERDAYIRRSKIVLNLHHHLAAKVFEIVRVSYLLANKKAVVSELSQDTDIEPDIRNAIVGVEYDDIPAACSELLADKKKRRALERRGFDIMTARRQSEYLSKVLVERQST